MTTELRHTVRSVALRTGLTAHVIRVWERLYGTVTPSRSSGNQRLYTEADVERLALLKQVTDRGHSISRVTALPTEQLSLLVSAEDRSTMIRTEAGGSIAGLLETAFQAVADMDAAGLERVLEQGALRLGQIGLLAQVVAPLVGRIGEAWREGHLKVVHEHIASAVIRTYLCQAARPHTLHPSAPVLLVTTPAGQLHELGAALVAAAATSHGWRVTYAAPALPAEEIAAAAIHHGVFAVALSLVHPEDDPMLPAELRRLRRLLPQAVHLLVGGRAAGAYRSVLVEIGAAEIATLEDLTAALGQLRQGLR